MSRPNAEPMGEMRERVTLAICAHCKDQIVNYGGSAWYHFARNGRHGEQQCHPVVAVFPDRAGEDK